MKEFFKEISTVGQLNKKLKLLNIGELRVLENIIFHCSRNYKLSFPWNRIGYDSYVIRLSYIIAIVKELDLIAIDNLTGQVHYQPNLDYVSIPSHKVKIPYDLIDEDPISNFDRSNYRCLSCGDIKTIDNLVSRYMVDPKIPFKTPYENIITICKSCNTDYNELDKLYPGIGHHKIATVLDLRNEILEDLLHTLKINNYTLSPYDIRELEILMLEYNPRLLKDALEDAIIRKSDNIISDTRLAINDFLEGAKDIEVNNNHYIN